jgi:hypothetical protein
MFLDYANLCVINDIDNWRFIDVFLMIEIYRNLWPKKMTGIDVLGGGSEMTFWGVKTTVLEGEKKGGIEKSRKKSL